MAEKLNSKSYPKNLIIVLIVSLLGLVSSVFVYECVDFINLQVLTQYKNVIKALSVSFTYIALVACLYFYGTGRATLYRLFLLGLFFLAISSVGLYFANKYGFLDRFTNVESFRQYIDSFGNNAVILFVLIQFLQVVVLPIPGFVTVGAGVLLFGAFKGAVLSYLGIVSGSLIAFFFGRIFGYKAVKWLIGEDNLKKGLKAVKGKDRIILVFMFLFPFFPDDILCFVAGISAVDTRFFILTVLVTRLISIFVASYSLNNSIIPFNTWWGILIWAFIAIVIVVLSLLIYKKGDKIEKFIFDKKNKKKTS